MDELTKLSNDTLDKLPEGVRVPRYDRSKLTPGIVHIGLGNFHRAHQAWYLHRLMDEGLAHDWAIIGAGVRPADAKQREKLLAQDCLTTLIELDPSGTSVEVVGSMIGYVPIEEGNGPLIEQMADPAIRIVSMTITEGAYPLDDERELDTDHPDVRHDAENPDRPKSAFGAIIAGLKKRRDAGTPPFTAQCCDNIRGNGNVLRRVIVSLARLSDPELADWIAANVAFPNAMVDCIVPATGEKELERVHEIGIDDAVPVTHENFRQWVLEDHFPQGRPPWEKVGATFSEDVHAYEEMKIRILNGGHQLCGEPGELMAIETISGSMENPAILGYWRATEREIAEQVHDVPGMTSTDYVDLIERRFSNPAIVDRNRRICFDASSKHPGFLHPTLRERLNAGKSIEGLALCEAIWARLCYGVREDGSTIPANDPHWDAIHEVAKTAKDRPEAWLEQKRFYGNLGKEPRFVERFVHWHKALFEDGVEATLKRFAAEA